MATISGWVTSVVHQAEQFCIFSFDLAEAHPCVSDRKVKVVAHLFGLQQHFRLVRATHNVRILHAHAPELVHRLLFSLIPDLGTVRVIRRHRINLFGFNFYIEVEPVVLRLILGSTRKKYQ